MNATALRLVQSPDTSKIETKSLELSDQAQILEVKNDESYKKSSEILLTIKDAIKEIDSTFGPIKKKSHDAWKEVIAQEKRHKEPLLVAEKSIKGKISFYLNEQEKKRRQEEAKLLAEAKKREEEERLALAIEAEKNGESKEAEAIIEKPKFVPAPIAPAPEKVSGISTRTVWKYKIIDVNAIPREFLIPDEKAIAGIVRSLGERTNIPGIQAYPERSVAAGRR